MTGYKKLSKKEELYFIKKVESMVNIGLWPDEIAELIEQPLDKVEEWVNICKWAKIINAQKRV